MSRRFVSQLGQQEAVSEVFLASGKQLRPNRNGNLYLQLELSDRTGSISARMWNADEDVYRSFDNGDYVHVVGTTQVFQGAMQLIATRVAKVEPSEVNEEDFTPVTSRALDALMDRLAGMLRGIRDCQLRNLAECFLIDDQLMEALRRAPAGVKHHHAYGGGLLEHVVKLMEVAAKVAPLYPQLDGDLLLMGAFLHDLGKVRELSSEHGLSYTDEGQLIGHLVIGVSLLEEKIRQAEVLSGEPFNEEKALRLKHMIVSHHGQYEFGSPKLPMTLEAVALHFLDNLDAKMAAFSQQMNEDPNFDSHWTCYHPSLGRKLFKGRPSRD